MIAITGAAGFIGANLAQRLAASDELLLVDLHPREQYWEGIPAFQFLGHNAFLDALAARALEPSAIFHLGACSDTTMTDWEYLRLTNIEYSRALWQYCAARGVPCIYASSAATYGDGSHGFDDRTPPEELRPLNLYGKSKNDFDAWALAQPVDASPPRWAGVKFFNVFGPRENHKAHMASVVWKALREIEATGEMSLFRSNDPAIADGEQRRDFVYVEDCIDHLLWLWRAPVGNGVYNSGTGHAHTFLELVSAVFAAVGRDAKIRFIDMPGELTGRYQNYTQAVMTKLQATGYATPATPLADAVRRSVERANAMGPIAELPS